MADRGQLPPPLATPPDRLAGHRRAEPGHQHSKSFGTAAIADASMTVSLRSVGRGRSCVRDLGRNGGDAGDQAARCHAGCLHADETGCYGRLPQAAPRFRAAPRAPQRGGSRPSRASIADAGAVPGNQRRGNAKPRPQTAFRSRGYRFQMPSARSNSSSPRFRMAASFQAVVSRSAWLIGSSECFIISGRF